jgi:TRAP transporter TAXI family solute receptor
MFDTPFHFAALKRAKLTSLDALAGKQIGAGPKAGTGGAYFPAIFKILEVASVLHHGAWDELTQQMVAGELDGLALAIGAPMPAAAALDARDPLDYLEPTPDQVARIRKSLPELTPSTIGAGIYPSLTKDYHTFGVYNFAVVHKDLPDELVYQIVKAVFEHRQELLTVHPAAKETVPDNAEKNGFLPFHPGAVRYYREVGVTIPGGLRD